MYKFLLVEDSDVDAGACIETVERMNDQAGSPLIQIRVATTVDNATRELKNEYDGVIVDIRLQGETSGNDVLREIIDGYRVPVAVMTGTPDTDLEGDSPIRIYKKGEVGYEAILTTLIRDTETGLFRVIGGKGKIEEAMNRVFWKNLYKQIDLWAKLRQDGCDTERVLMRYAIAHIHELVDDEVPKYVTEEMYISPPFTDDIRTGSIVQSLSNNGYCIVLSPPCDLAKRDDGCFKTDRILLCEIDSLAEVSKRITETASTNSRKIKCLLPAIQNNLHGYYHWLPKNSLFPGGYVNFRRVLSYEPEKLSIDFRKPKIRVQEYFVKDILGRFSAYYARQGQPDFDFEREAELLLTCLLGLAQD